jgi:hypothetical protein
LNKETSETYVAWCPHHGIPLYEANYADGWSWCLECDKLYRVLIKEGKVTVIEDNKITYEQSAILRWRMGVRYAARQHIAKKRDGVVVSRLSNSCN